MNRVVQKLDKPEGSAGVARQTRPHDLRHVSLHARAILIEGAADGIALKRRKLKTIAAIEECRRAAIPRASDDRAVRNELIC